MTPSTARRTKKKDAKPVSTRPFIAHHLAPPHEILTEDESQKVLVGLSTTAERLPKIFLSDPGLQTDPKFIPLRDAGENLVGRIVRVHRPSQTAGQALAYRVIVPSVGSS
ncbi:MAG TPA: DNA-directed RNA polymerase subunit RpoH/Rpb5 C-terminal domain-containing protein [Thermoplasmata archaeon]|nr:DNA-directed RNA polymerase subunit RpoH/Rpb5 C-terminal domain-containing protein [Thermoplasmata archaeon]